MRKALPTTTLSIDGVDQTVLVDSGCSCCIIYAPLCDSWVSENVSVLTVNGERQRCLGVGHVQISVDGFSATVKVFVVGFKPLGFSCILGMNGISALGGVTISSSLSVRFGCSTKGVCFSAIAVSRDDFEVSFDSGEKQWVVQWNWADGRAPEVLNNAVEEYEVPDGVREQYDAELRKWVEKGWLQVYDEKKMGPVKGLIPLLAVVQPNKNKVRPVMDFRELNSHVDALTGDADVCSERLREWRRCGADCSVLDLRDAYMQIGVHESLWPYQTVIFQNRRYCMTRLGFGLSVAPAVMKTVLQKVLDQDATVKRGVSPYVDDIYVNNSIVHPARVGDLLARYGLHCKPAEDVASGARVLGLWVQGRDRNLVWKRCNGVPESPSILTRRSVFSLCGRLVSHLPVCGWLRPAAAFLKRKVNSLTSSWDEKVDDHALRRLVDDIVKRVALNDPAHGRWDVQGSEATLWVDASSLAVGTALAVEGNIIEDASWLRTERSTHINMAELDAVIKGMNLALTWGMLTLHIKTDSQTVLRWVSDALSGRCRLRTKAASELLIRRRLGIITSLVEEYNAQVDVSFVPSALNVADPLTRVPKDWIRADADSELCNAALGADDKEVIAEVHHLTGHQGVDRSFYFARKLLPNAERRVVKEVVSACDRCQSIDPATPRWTKGALDVDESWLRLGMDITHYNDRHFLTLIDHGPSRFAVWRPLRRQDSISVVEQLESVFFDHGAPSEILTDNDMAFRSGAFDEFAKKWGVRVRFRCAHVPSGNGITERSHRTIKRIAARKQCGIQEAVYWYNVSPKDGDDPSSAPANRVFRYNWRILGVDFTEPADGEEAVCSRFRVGDSVWVRPVNGRCTTRYGRGHVTGTISQQAVEVDGIPRHVRDLMLASAEDDPPELTRHEDDGVDLGSLHGFGHFPRAEVSDEDSSSVASRRPVRDVGPPDWYGVRLDPNAAS